MMLLIYINMLSNKKNIYKLYFYIKSFFFNYLYRDVVNLFLFLKKNNILLKKNIIFFPVKIKKFSVVKSPFVSKLSKDQFEIKIYKVLIIIFLKNKLLLNFFKEKNLLKFNFNYIYYNIVYYFTFKK